MAKTTKPARKQNVAARHDSRNNISGAEPSESIWMHVFLCLCLGVTAAALTVYTTQAADLFWQVRVGHDTLALGHPPFVDTYSWTRYGQPWVVNEWLSFVIFYEAFQWTQGFAGVFVLEEIMVITIAVSLYYFLYQSTKSAFTTFFLSSLATTACILYFEPRPYLFTFLFLIITVGICLQVRQHLVPNRTLWLLIPLCALWANLHQGVTVGVGFISILALSDIAETFWFLYRRDSVSRLEHKANALRFSLLSAACLTATLVTPYGLGLYKMILVTITDREAMSVVSEWKPLHLSVSVYDGSLLMLVTLLLIGLARNRSKVGLGELLFLLLIAYEAVVHRRNLPLAVLAGTLIAAPLIAPVLLVAAVRLKKSLIKTEHGEILRSKTLSLILTGSVVALAAFTYAVVTISHYDITSDSSLEGLAVTCYGTEWYPGEACSFIEYQHFPADLRFFNDYNLGGFLILHCPDHPVFVDGRADVYAGSLVDGALSLYDTPPKAVELPQNDKNFLKSYQYDCVVTTTPLVAKFFAQQSEWSLVYVHHLAPILDRKGVNAWIFLHHRPDLEKLIARSQSDWAAHHHGILPSAGL